MVVEIRDAHLRVDGSRARLGTLDGRGGAARRTGGNGDCPAAVGRRRRRGTHPWRRRTRTRRRPGAERSTVRRRRGRSRRIARRTTISPRRRDGPSAADCARGLAATPESPARCTTPREQRSRARRTARRGPAREAARGGAGAATGTAALPPAATTPESDAGAYIGICERVVAAPAGGNESSP